jgi:ABC-type tungstate transport system permease subunit
MIVRHVVRRQQSLTKGDQCHSQVAPVNHKPMAEEFSQIIAPVRLVALVLITLGIGPAQADERFIMLSSTTSTQDSGLFRHILPIFTATTSITVHFVAVGTGQALAIGARGDADA